MKRSCNYYRLIIVAVLLALVSAGPVRAAELYLDPDSGSLDRERGVFSVDMRLNNGDECVNAVEAHLNYPTEYLEATLVSRGRSILSFWPEEPRIDRDEGVVSFVGGIPGGYCGRIPGDPGLTNVLVTIAFQPAQRVVDTDEIVLQFDDERSEVLLDDGRGTSAGAEFRDGVYEVTEDGTLDIAGWLTDLEEDALPPEPFEIHIMSDESVYDGQYYIVFSTTDKGTGLSHFEVKEEDRDRPGYIYDTDREAGFREAESPYRLRDQTLNSIISVRAVDKAGNERLARMIPDEELRRRVREERDELSWWEDKVAMVSLPVGVVVSAAVLLLVLIISWLYLRRKNKHHHRANF